MVLPPTTTIAFHGSPFAEAPCDTPAAVLPEPGGLAIVGLALLALGAFRMLRRMPATVPDVRATILVREELWATDNK